MKYLLVYAFIAVAWFTVGLNVMAHHWIVASACGIAATFYTYMVASEKR